MSPCSRLSEMWHRSCDEVAMMCEILRAGRTPGRLEIYFEKLSKTSSVWRILRRFSGLLSGSGESELTLVYMRHDGAV